jgi:hypothetical protein
VLNGRLGVVSKENAGGWARHAEDLNRKAKVRLQACGIR